jgi:hypothetical protein
MNTFIAGSIGFVTGILVGFAFRSFGIFNKDKNRNGSGSVSPPTVPGAPHGHKPPKLKCS